MKISRIAKSSSVYVILDLNFEKFIYKNLNFNLLLNLRIRKL